MAHLPPLPLPPSIRQRHIDLTTTPSSGLNTFLLEAGNPQHPLILLFHGYPELAYTWRHLLLPLAAAGFHVVAPDARGYGRTTGWDTSSYAHTDLAQFTQLQLVLDTIALLRALRHDTAALLVGHDFGCNAAAGCVLARPDLFRAAVFMSHVPSAGLELPRPPSPPPPRAGEAAQEPSKMAWDADVHTSLARRTQPLKHYQWYNSTAAAAHDWAHPPQGLRAFLRGYVHLKSHAWARNAVGIGPLTGWTAEQLARMPGYYTMPRDATMPQVVARDMAGEDPARTAAFVSDAELDVYVHEFGRTGFQGMLNWYRAATDARDVNAQMAVFAGRPFGVPVVYLGGEADWGNYQRPGALEALASGTAATDCRGITILPGAGHWPQTEIPDVVCREILGFLEGLREK